MKKMIAFLLLLLSFVYLCGFSFFERDSIDRSLPLKFEYKGTLVNNVFVNMEIGYAYHNYSSCHTERLLLGIERDSYIEISEYEAILRGFFECPGCSDNADSADITDLEEKLYDIEWDVEAIMEALDL